MAVPGAGTGSRSLACGSEETEALPRARDPAIGHKRRGQEGHRLDETLFREKAHDPCFLSADCPSLATSQRRLCGLDPAGNRVEGQEITLKARVLESDDAPFIVNCDMWNMAGVAIGKDGDVETGPDRGTSAG